MSATVFSVEGKLTPVDMGMNTLFKGDERNTCNLYTMTIANVTGMSVDLRQQMEHPWIDQ